MKIKTTHVFIVILIALVAAPIFISAALIQTAEEYSLVKGETISENLYVVGGKVTISGDVQGDLIIAGGDVIVTGNVSEDVLIIGGSLSILGEIAEDLRVAGGQVTIGGNVGKDIVAAGGMIHILSNVTVNGDILVGGGKVIIDGVVKGDVNIGGKEITINGQVEGDVRARVQEIKIGKEAVISGNLVYDAPKKAVIDESASIAGEVVFNEAQFFPQIGIKNIFQKIGILFAVAKLFALLAAALVAVFIFRRFSTAVVEQSLSHPWMNLLRGFVVLIVVPVAAFLLLISVLGSLIGVVGVLVYILFLLIAKVYAGIVLGSWILKRFTKTKEAKIDWKAAVAGVLLLYLISFLPIFGGIVNLLVLLVVFGSISYLSYRQFWLTRKG